MLNYYLKIFKVLSTVIKFAFIENVVLHNSVKHGMTSHEQPKYCVVLSLNYNYICMYVHDLSVIHSWLTDWMYVGNNNTDMYIICSSFNTTVQCDRHDMPPGDHDTLRTYTVYTLTTHKRTGWFTNHLYLDTCPQDTVYCTAYYLHDLHTWEVCAILIPVIHSVTKCRVE